MMAVLDFLYVRAWGRLMGSDQYYIRGQVQKAREDNAPEDATWWDDNIGRWHRWSELPDTNTNKSLLNEFAEGMR